MYKTYALSFQAAGATPSELKAHSMPGFLYRYLSSLHSLIAPTRTIPNAVQDATKLPYDWELQNFSFEGWGFFFFLFSVKSVHSFSCLAGSKGGLCCGMFVLESCGSVSTCVPLHVGRAGKNVNCDVMSVNNVGTTGTCIPSAFSYHKEGQNSKSPQRSQCSRST